MPYIKPGVETQRVGLPGTPLGNTNFFIPTVIAKTLGAETQVDRTALVSGDAEAVPIFIDGQMVQVGDDLNYEKVSYSSSTKMTAALSNLPVQNVLSVTADHTNPYRREFQEGIEFTVNKVTGVLDFTNAPVIPVPEVDNLAQGTGGSIADGTYAVAIVAVDANNVQTPAAMSQITIVGGGGNASLTVAWGKISTAAGYEVYVQPAPAVSSTWQLPALGTITSGTVSSVVLTVAITAGGTTLQTVNATKHTPANSADVFINYTYLVYNYASPKRYFDTNTLQQDHGIGSEIANAGLLVMGPAGVGAAAGSMYVVAPETSTGLINGYQDAISACESIADLILMASSSTSDTVNETLVAHCESMSAVEEGKTRFCFVSTTSAVQADSNITKVTAKILALNGSNRAVYVITDGGHPTLNQWQNTPDLVNVLTGKTQASSYTADVPVDGPWHAIAMMGMVAALPDPATPPTNKQVFGISSGIAGTVRLWNDARKNAVASVGGSVLEDRFNNLFVRHGLTISQASVEDSEISIVLAEGYMGRALADAHRQFIGSKLTDSLLAGVTATTKKTLDGLVASQILRSYSGLTVYQDTVNPTKVFIKFSYKPIYPTDNLVFQWSFNLAG